MGQLNCPFDEYVRLATEDFIAWGHRINSSSPDGLPLVDVWFSFSTGHTIVDRLVGLLITTRPPSLRHTRALYFCLFVCLFANYLFLVVLFLVYFFIFTNFNLIIIMFSHEGGRIALVYRN